MTTFGLKEFEAAEVNETARFVKLLPAPTAETDPATFTDWFSVKSSSVMTAAWDANEAVIAKPSTAIFDFMINSYLVNIDTHSPTYPHQAIAVPTI